MKVVIYVDYVNANFNKDFMLANALLSREHNVFLVINDNQLHMYDGKLDILLIGFSSNVKPAKYEYIDLDNDLTIDDVIEKYRL